MVQSNYLPSILNRKKYTSIIFNFQAGTVEKIEYPLLDHQKMVIMRNVEKMLAEALHDPSEVGIMLKSIVLGRYTSDTI